MFRKKIVEEISPAFDVQLLVFENRAVYKIMWKNMAEPDRPQITLYGTEEMQFLCRITKAGTQTHTQYTSGLYGE
jgi:hypothetical protein